jgi:hypothetical protein
VRNGYVPGHGEAQQEFADEQRTVHVELAGSRPDDDNRTAATNFTSTQQARGRGKKERKADSRRLTQPSSSSAHGKDGRSEHK